MPFNIPVGDIAPAMAAGVSDILNTTAQRHNDELQMRLAELNLKQQAMQQNAAEAANNYALAVQRLKGEQSYRTNLLDLREQNLGLRERQANDINTRFGNTMELRREGLGERERHNVAEEGLSRGRQDIAWSEQGRKYSNQADLEANRAARLAQGDERITQTGVIKSYQALIQQDAIDQRQIGTLKKLALTNPDPEVQRNAIRQARIINDQRLARKTQIDSLGAQLMQGATIADQQDEDSGPGAPDQAVAAADNTIYNSMGDAQQANHPPNSIVRWRENGHIVTARVK